LSDSELYGTVGMVYSLYLFYPFQCIYLHYLGVSYLPCFVVVFFTSALLWVKLHGTIFYSTVYLFCTIL
jgi:hypothetical protein